jgi:hypothetical protein
MNFARRRMAIQYELYGEAETACQGAPLRPLNPDNR